MHLRNAPIIVYGDFRAEPVETASKPVRRQDVKRTGVIVARITVSPTGGAPSPGRPPWCWHGKASQAHSLVPRVQYEIPAGAEAAKRDLEIAPDVPRLLGPISASNLEVNSLSRSVTEQRERRVEHRHIGMVHQRHRVTARGLPVEDPRDGVSLGSSTSLQPSAAKLLAVDACRPPGDLQAPWPEFEVSAIAQPLFFPCVAKGLLPD